MNTFLFVSDITTMVSASKNPPSTTSLSTQGRDLPGQCETKRRIISKLIEAPQKKNGECPFLYN